MSDRDNQKQPAAEPSIEDFLGDTSHDLRAWRWLWDGDRAFPLRSHRGAFGRLVVALKRLLRPLVTVPQKDLWDRQRAFNLVLLSHLDRLPREIAEVAAELSQVNRDLLRDLRQVRDDLAGDVKNHHRRLAHLEAFKRDGLEEIMRHGDALYSLLDQKLDRLERMSRRLQEELSKLESTGPVSKESETEPA